MVRESHFLRSGVCELELEGPRVSLAPFSSFTPGSEALRGVNELCKAPQLATGGASLEGSDLESQLMIFPPQFASPLPRNGTGTHSPLGDAMQVVFFIPSVMHFFFLSHFEEMLPNCSPGSGVSIRRGGAFVLGDHNE